VARGSWLAPAPCTSTRHGAPAPNTKHPTPGTRTSPVAQRLVHLRRRRRRIGPDGGGPVGEREIAIVEPEAAVLSGGRAVQVGAGRQPRRLVRVQAPERVRRRASKVGEAVAEDRRALRRLAAAGAAARTVGLLAEQHEPAADGPGAVVVEAAVE